MRIVAIGALDMAVGGIQIVACLEQIRVLRRVNFARRLLMGVGDRHARLPEGEISPDIRHLKGGIALTVQDSAISRMTGVAGFLLGGVTTGFGSQETIRALAQQLTGALHRVRIVAIQAARLPHRHIERKFAQAGGRAGIGFVGRQGVGMGGLRPCLAELVMAGEANDIVVFIEVRAGRKAFLKAMQAQKLDVFRDIAVADMGIVAAGALQLAVFQRHQRPHTGRAVGDMRLEIGIAQFPVGVGQGAVVGERNRVVVTQIGAEVTCKPGINARARRHDAAGAGAVHGNGYVGLRIDHVDLADGDGAVMAGQAQLGAAARRRRDVVGVDRSGRIGGVCSARLLAVP